MDHPCVSVVFGYFGVVIWELYLMRLYNLGILLIYGLTVVGVWFWEYLRRYVSLAMFYVNLNVILRVLSVEMAVASRLLGLSNLIRILSNNLWTM